jgi:hypothetical protein
MKRKFKIMASASAASVFAFSGLPQDTSNLSTLDNQLEVKLTASNN